MTKRVPRVFHFVFGLRPQTESFHLLYYLCLKSCLEVNKPDKIVFHYQNEPWGPWWERIKPLLELRKVFPNNFMAKYEYSDATLNSVRYAHLSDFTRMEALYEYGGVYADIDTLFVSPLPDKFFAESFVMGEEMSEHTPDGEPKTAGSLCNAWMMAEPGAPFLKLWMEQMVENFDGSWNNHSTLLPYRLSQQHPDLIHIEPRRSFFHLSYITQDLNRLFFEDYTDLEGVYSIHLWNHLWQDKLWWNKKVAGSQFLSGEVITPAYIRFSNSTYANVSKRFLPEDISATPMENRTQRFFFNLRALFTYFPARLRDRIRPAPAKQ